nr:MAG TPA: hypothetical protein [Caudoviricetes sp.]
MDDNGETVSGSRPDVSQYRRKISSHVLMIMLFYKRHVV